MAIDILQELQEKRTALAAEIKELGNRQEEWQAEDRQKWDELNTAYDDNQERMEAEREKADVVARMSKLEETRDEERFDRSSEVKQARQDRAGVLTEEQRGLILQAWMRAANDLDLLPRHEEACAIGKVNPHRKGFDAFRRSTSANRGLAMWHRNGRALQPDESRAMTVGTDSEGGYTVPEGFSGELERAMLAFGGPRQVCRIFSTPTGNDLPWPTVDDTSNTGELLAESGSIGSSTDPTFGVVTFNAYKYSSKAVLVTQELLEDSAFNMGEILGSLLGERIGRITATQFTTGTGSSQPNGLATAATAGVTAASATAITADELIDLVHSLDPAYRGLSSVGFMAEDATIKAIRKLKDGNSQYLWQPGLQSSEPDQILGYPYTVNQDVASIASSAISVLFAAFEKYVIRDVSQVRFYRLEERYRDNDQTGFIMFSRHDGDAIQTGAIKKLTQAA